MWSVIDISRYLLLSVLRTSWDNWTVLPRHYYRHHHIPAAVARLFSSELTLHKMTNYAIALVTFLHVIITSVAFSPLIHRAVRCQGTRLSETLLQASTTEAPVVSEVWWKDGLKFACTACGRCCQNEGEVWLDTDEFADLSTNLNEAPEAVLEKYTEKTMSGWVKLKNQISDDPKIHDRCIFLGADGKECSIYNSRPIQCRTYPFWPRLLSSPAEWDKEAVQPDTFTLTEGSVDRHWTATLGGCEGDFVALHTLNQLRLWKCIALFERNCWLYYIKSQQPLKIWWCLLRLQQTFFSLKFQNTQSLGFTNPLAAQISTRTIHRNHELYKMYNDVFPFISSGDDEKRLIAKTGVIHVSGTCFNFWPVTQFSRFILLKTVLASTAAICSFSHSSSRIGLIFTIPQHHKSLSLSIYALSNMYIGPLFCLFPCPFLYEYSWVDIEYCIDREWQRLRPLGLRISYWSTNYAPLRNTCSSLVE